MKNLLIEKLGKLQRNIAGRNISKIQYQDRLVSPNTYGRKDLVLVIPQSEQCMVLWDKEPNFSILTYSYCGRPVNRRFLGSTHFDHAGLQADRHISFESEGLGESWDQVLSVLSDGHKYALIASEDTLIRSSDVEYLFALAISSGLDFFHPSLSLCSYGTHEHLFNRPGSMVRKVPHIEGIFPGFSARAISHLKQYPNLSTSSYGLDAHLWPAIAEKHQFETAVIDAVTIRHVRPVRSGTLLFSNGLTARQETEAVKAFVLSGGVV